MAQPEGFESEDFMELVGFMSQVSKQMGGGYLVSIESLTGHR